jgi:hypothetical protein
VMPACPIQPPRSRVASRLALPAQDEDVAALRRAVIAKLTYAVGKDPVVATERDWFVADRAQTCATASSTVG